jgi:hypothetical protein
VSDPTTGHLLSQPYDGTWTGDGTTWTHHVPPPELQRRVGAALAADPVRRTVVLFGGRSSQPLTADTWTWDGSTWTHRAGPTVTPPTPFPTPYPVAVATAAAACTSPLLPTINEVTAGADGITITIHLVDRDGSECPTLAGPVRLVDATGRPLPVTGESVTIPTHATQVSFTWHNWCGVGPVGLQLPVNAENTPVSLAALAPCVNRNAPSTITGLVVGVAMP